MQFATYNYININNKILQVNLADLNFFHCCFLFLFFSPILEFQADDSQRLMENFHHDVHRHLYENEPLPSMKKIEAHKSKKEMALEVRFYSFCRCLFCLVCTFGPVQIEFIRLGFRPSKY